MQGVFAENFEMARQLYGVAPDLRGRTTWQQPMASGRVVDPILYNGVPTIEWSPEKVAMPPNANAGEALLDTATGFFFVAAGALVGYAASTFRPATAMLGTGGSMLSTDRKEELAKRAWLAKQDVPSWGPTSRKSLSEPRYVGRLASTRTAPLFSDDHTNPGERLVDNNFGRVPMATWTPAAEMVWDDHTSPGNCLAFNDFGRVPMATLTKDSEMVCDDHTNPGDRLATGEYGRVPMSTAAPAAGKARNQSAGTAEERAKRAWLANLDAPSWGKR